MSIWTSIRDTILRPVARAVIPGYSMIDSANKGASVPQYNTAPSFSDARYSAANPALATSRGVTGMSLYNAGRTAGSVVRTVGRALPGVGTAMAVAGAAEALYEWVTGPDGSPVKVSKRTGRAVSQRRRSKGITGRELKSFTRVTHILNKYCKTAPPRRRSTGRGKACR